MSIRNNYEGMKFNYLLVIKYDHDGRWICRCDCGVEKSIRGFEFSRGRIKSCGCMAAELRYKVNQDQVKGKAPKDVRPATPRPPRFEPDYS